MLANPPAPLMAMPPGESQNRLAGLENEISLSMKLPKGLVTPTNTFCEPPLAKFTPVMPPRVSKAEKRWNKLLSAFVPPPTWQRPAEQLPPLSPLTAVPRPRAPPVAVTPPAMARETARSAVRLRTTEAAWLGSGVNRERDDKGQTPHKKSESPG